jgi:hypothetical protein
VKKKRIVRTAEVTIETEETVALRSSQGKGSSLMWCPACRRQVEMVAPEQAAEIAGVSTRAIYRWIEAGPVHFTEARGYLLICVASLPLPTHNRRNRVFQHRGSLKGGLDGGQK